MYQFHNDKKEIVIDKYNTLTPWNTNATVESVRMLVDGLLGEREFTGKSRLNGRKTWSTLHIH